MKATIIALIVTLIWLITPAWVYYYTKDFEQSVLILLTYLLYYAVKIELKQHNPPTDESKI